MSADDNKFSASIFDAIKTGNIEKLEYIIKKGGTINEIDKQRDQFTPLHCAAYYGSLECLHWLLWKGADNTMVTPKGWTPLHIAVMRGQQACVEALIESGANVNAKDNRGQTPAHLAATHGYSHTLQTLLRRGADISIQDSNGWSPIHTASYHGRLGCIQFLKSAGAKFDECDNEGNNAVHLASMEGHLPCLKYMLANVLSMDSVLKARNDQGDTPKTLAEQFFKTATVEYLEAVEWEKDHPEQADNLAFPAHVAAFNGDLNHLKLLIEQGVININERDDKGCTPAHKAAGQGHLAVLQWLVENGANVTLRNNMGETARDIAQRFAQLGCSRLLEVEAGEEEDTSNSRKAFENEDEKPVDSLKLNSEQKKQARLRAKKKVEEIEKLLERSRNNFLQLGGRKEDIEDSIFTKERSLMKEQARTISELENELEGERLKRERLEAQLDQCRQEIEKSVKQLKDYESKVTIMEKCLKQSLLTVKATSKKSGQKSSTTQKIQKRPDSAKRVSSASKTNEDRPGSGIKKNERTLEYLNLKNGELKELKNAFSRFDRNETDFISVEDLRDVYKNLNIKLNNEELQSIKKVLNKYDDDKIDFNDFVEYTAKKFYKKYSKEEIKEAFRKFDTNNSGNISLEELRSVLSKMGRLYTEDEIEELIDTVDTNRDGFVSIEEFSHLLN